MIPAMHLHNVLRRHMGVNLRRGNIGVPQNLLNDFQPDS
jgi:hypothetical protein